jgi:ABC-type branched-subunit amino acid transport system permease subunit
VLSSILSTGLAIGAIYALIAVTYNVMFSASRVMSFTAGQVGMLGGVFGACFILRLHLPIVAGFPLTLLACAGTGVLTEVVAVRPVMAGLEKHLYVLSTLALALMMQQFTAIEWSTEPQPFPRIVGGGLALGEKFWLPLLAAAAVILGLELLYRCTLVGRAFLAIAEDNYAARAWFARTQSAPGELRACRRDRGVGGLRRRAASAGLDRERADAELLRLRSRGARRAGQQSRRNRGRTAARPVSASGKLPGGRRARLGRGLCGVYRRSDGCAAGSFWDAAGAACLMRSRVAALPYVVIFAAAAAIPLAGDDYLVVIATRAAVYWVLVSGLNLVVGFAGQLAIGWVSLLTIGAYTTSIIVARGWLGPLPALAIAGVAGALAGVLVGLPALRLRTFYFAMTTLGFATIVTQVALAWTEVTGGGIGIAGPALPAPLDSQTGFYLFCLALAGLCTWMTLNIAARRCFCSAARRRRSPVAYSRRCRATSRPTPSPSTSRSCSSSRS